MSPIDSKTQLIGLLGWPVSHSFSPAMHNAAAAALGLNWLYVAMAVKPDEVATAVAGLPALGFRGVNVTVPHKQAVMPFLDTITAGAQAIGAVNTIVITRNEDGEPHLTGHNTDWNGFLADLQAHKVDIVGRDCLVFGAGGSARAVVYGLVQAGANVQLLARRPEQAQQLCDNLSPHLPEAILQARPLTALATAVDATHAPLIVNTTPLGMTPDVASSVWPTERPFPPGAFVYDLVYNPTTTRFMKQAAKSGCRTANGLGMLLRQGATAFTLWTGHEPDINIMHAALP